jgi:hypothetical protein
MRIVFSLVLSFALLGCIKNNPDPSWLKINKWTLLSNSELSGEDGELTENISEAWIYIDDKPLGVFQVPCKIPILKSGSSNIKIFPAIKNNGISATKKIYPFLEVFEIQQELSQKDTLILNPKTKYKTNAKFKIYDFEQTNLFLENDPNYSLAKIQFDNFDLQPFNGNFYGRVTLNQKDSVWKAYTKEQMQFTKGKDVYLEMDYYNSNSILTGLIFVNKDGTTSNNPNIQLNAQNEPNLIWKKIYIDLKELIASSPNESNYLQSFQAFLNQGKSSSEIRIDNIKLVYFE